MKKIILGFCIFLIMSSALGQVKNNIKLNYLDGFTESLSILYERTITKKISLQLQSTITVLNYQVGYFSRRVGGYRFIPELRYYLSSKKEFPEGWFIGVFVGYYHLPYTAPAYKYTVTPGSTITVYDPRWIYSGFGGGGLIGYQKALKRNYNLGFYIGPQYYIGHTKFNHADAPNSKPSNLNPYFLNGIGMRIGATVGKAF